MSHTAKVCVEVESRPENLALVRRVLAAFADAIALDWELLGDIATAVNEACNNVVLHAYDGSPGPMIVSLEATRESIEAQVEDRGAGMRRVSADRRSFGIGMPVIGALADHAEFASADGRGTRVRMEFGCRREESFSCSGAAPPAHRRPAGARQAQSA